MNEEAINSPFKEKTEVKLSQKKKNVIPITSITDLGTVVGEIQNQLTLLVRKLEGEVSPEFKALMEGYVNKANQTEEFKVKLEHINSLHEALKLEVTKVRETNRNLIHELQSARESLKNLEFQFNNLQTAMTNSEEEYENEINKLNRLNEEYQAKINELEEEKEKNKEIMEKKIAELKEEQERLKDELSNQNFEFKNKEREFLGETDNLRKQVEELETIISEQNEQIDLKTKEAEYKEALLTQFIKQSTNDKFSTKHLKPQKSDEMDVPVKKKKFLFFG